MQIVLIEDHELIRHGIKSVINNTSKVEELQVVGEFSNAEEALEFLSKSDGIDLVVTDINLPKKNGLKLAAEIKNQYPAIKVIVLSSYDDEEYVTEAIMLDLEGYILKDSIADEILVAIEKVSSGESFYSDKVLDVAIQSHQKHNKSLQKKDGVADQISPREREVLLKIADGHKNSEIAEMLFISERTVETHRSSLLRKFQSKSSAEMIKKAIKKSVI
jgi:DNA-binding NarL/FixJ family response regulator